MSRAAPHRRAPPRSALLWLLLPLLAVLAIYLPPSLGADWVVDDWGQLARHQHPGDWVGEWTHGTHEHAVGDKSYVWRPIPFSLYQLWGEAFGRTAAAFRILNVGALLLVVGLGFLAARRAGASARAAGLAMLVLVAHPLTPDVASWNATLNDLLAAAFLFGALALALGQKPDGGAGRRLPVHVVGAALLFLGALLSKEAALAWLAALPLILLLLRGWRAALTHGLALLPVAVLQRRWKDAVIGDAVEFDPLDTVRTHGPELVAAYTDYLRWPLTRPVDATFTHLLVPGAESIAWGGVAVVLVGAGVAAIATARSRPEGPRLGAAVGTYALMMAPGAVAAATFLLQPGRYAWLAAALALPLLAAATPRTNRPGLGVLAVGALCLAWLPDTLTRVDAYASDRALYNTELQAEPDNPFPQREVGRALVAAGDLEQGLPLWSAALAHPPASAFVFDPQQDRLDLAQAAAAGGAHELAVAQLDAFITAEQAAGRGVHQSILQLRQRISESR